MSKQHIHFNYTFKAPVETVFNLLTDHEAFGKMIGANIQRIQDGTDGFINGVGSIRQIKAFPAPAFEETVITFEPNKRMEYVVSKGSPIKEHIGKMNFSENAGVTTLDYTIEFEPKIKLPLTGTLLKKAIETPVRKALSKLSCQYG